MKVIFLDINGVLNSFEYYENMEIDEMLEHPLDPLALKRLCSILQQSDAKIVLSSSNRHGWHKNPDKRNAECKQLTDIFNEYGIEIYDCTPHSTSRAKEIRMWLNRHPFTKYVIIDDSDSDWDKYRLSNHFVKTSLEDGGLTDEHTKRVLKLLLS